MYVTFRLLIWPEFSTKFLLKHVMTTLWYLSFETLYSLTISVKLSWLLTNNHSFIHNFTFSHQNHVNPEEEIEIVLSILSSESNFFLFLSFPHSPPSTKWLFAWKKYLCNKSTSMLCTTIALYSIRCFFSECKARRHPQNQPVS